MDILPTIKIQDGDGYAIINERDFNFEIHEVYAHKSRKKKKVVDIVTNANVDDTLIDRDVVNDEG